MNTKFYGEDDSCQYCSQYPKAKENHFCKRGKELRYKLCGTNEEIKKLNKED